MGILNKFWIKNKFYETQDILTLMYIIDFKNIVS